jgi:PKD repeat protein
MRKSPSGAVCKSRFSVSIGQAIESLERRVLLSVTAPPVQQVGFAVGPMAADPVRNRVYVIDATDSKVLAIDTDLGRTVSFADLPAGYVPGLAVSPDGSRLYVSEPAARQIQSFALPDLTPGPVIPTTFGTGMIAIGSGNRLYAGNAPGSSALGQFDLGTGQYLGSFGAGLIYDPMLEASADGNTLYAFDLGLSGSPTAIGMFDVTGGQTPVPLNGPQVPMSNGKDFAIDDQYHRIYTASGGVYGLGVTDDATGTTSLWPWAAGADYGAAVTMLPTGTVLYGASYSSIREYNRADGSPIADFTPGGSNAQVNGAAMRITPNGRVLFAADVFSNGTTHRIGEIGGPGTLVIDDVPAARFTWQYGTAAGHYFFDASASEPFRAGETITSYAWNFGDGFTGTGVTPAHTFTANGTYNVQLTVTSSSGVTNMFQVPLSVSGLSTTYGPTLGADGTLTINGSDANDSVELAYVPASPAAPATDLVTFNGVGYSFPYASVAQIVVNGLGGDDSLTLDSLLFGNITFDGGTGTNSVVYNGSQGDDTINLTASQVSDAYVTLNYANIQSLRVNALFGFDTINASGALPASTTLDGGDGNDTFNANSRLNTGGVTTPLTILGGAGDDVIRAGTAPSVIDGGTGNDRIFARNRAADTITGGGGIDYAQTDASDVVSGITPAASLLGLATVAEGSPYTLDITAGGGGTGTSLNYAVSWGDNSTNSSAFGTGTIFVTHTYADGPATRTINVTPSDQYGRYDSVGALVTVTNVPPIPAILGVPTISPEGTPITLTASATDPSPVDIAAGIHYVWSVTKNGAAFVQGTGASFAFAPDDNGGYAVTLAATDKDGGTNAVTRSINVSNVAPKPTILGAPTTSPEGTTITLTASATDPSYVDTAAGFTYGWSVLENGRVFLTAASPNLTFTPAYNGTYLAILTATDKDHGSRTASKTINVVDVIPRPTIAGIPNLNYEAAQISLTALVTDSNPADTAAGFTYAWNVTKNGSAYAQGTAAAFTFTPDDNGGYIVTLGVTDKDGATGSTFQIINVLDVAPSPILTLPANSMVGTPVTLTASATDPSPVDTAAGFTYTWNVTKDGTAFANGTGATFTYTPDDGGYYMVSLTATDKDGLGATSGQTLYAFDFSPSPTIAETTTTYFEGTPINLTANVYDPIAADWAAGFTYAWNITQDGVTVASGAGPTLTFTPADSGNYFFGLSVTDHDGETGTVSESRTIFNVAPTPSIQGLPASSPEQTPITLTASATDPSTADTSAGFVYGWTVYKWGNLFATGSGSQFTFTPDDDGNYLVSLTAKDKDGASGELDRPITITNVPPAPALPGLPASSPEGTPITLTGTATDPNPADRAAGFTYTWNVTKDGTGFASGAGPTFTFTPNDNAVYAVSLTAMDQDRETGTITQSVQVTNVAPTAGITGPATAHRGTSNRFTLSATDPSSADMGAGFTFTINWGDGSTAQALFGPSGLTANHTFASRGTYNITVYATDKDGAAGLTSTFQIKVT